MWESIENFLESSYSWMFLESGESWRRVVRIKYSGNLASTIRFWISSSRVRRFGDLSLSGSPFVHAELFWRATTWVWRCWLSNFNSSYSQRMLSRLTVICSRSRFVCNFYPSSPLSSHGASERAGLLTAERGERFRTAPVVRGRQ